ncbi:SCO1/SenC family protein [Hydrogenophaga sp. RAC07]|uniref:SCO family protein n=1 Tax=Hydrogenophaga sp. RAC07 TaxID=1842537 RepID=UPI00083D90E0|nr:SCO family protein [Hydrogenophaga sp. RAC07]AOF85202.1 SCO1/SenC family protein [Hydrogenophaga sp. RAC07]
MNTRRHLLAGLGVAALGALGTRTAFAAPSAAKPTAAQRIPNVALRTHTGATVKFYDDLVRGKIVVINMMYADCEGLCPPMTNNLVRVQQLLGKRVGKDIFMYSITLRPEQDTPEDLADYAEMHGVEPGWTFLTGAPQDIERLRYALGFYDPDPNVDKQAARHVGMVRIGNDAFNRWSMAPALALPEQIVSSILHVDRRTAASPRAR